jgi:fucose permease
LDLDKIRSRMGVIVSLTVGLVIWIVLWALGSAKPFDAFLIPCFLVVMAATAQIAKPYIEKLIKP